MTIVYAVLVIGGILVLSGLVWRLFSSRASIPCPSWLGWLVELDNPLFRNNRADAIIDHLDIEWGMNVLDFGCGPGRLTLPLARKVGPDGLVTALDLQAAMIAKVKARSEAEHLGNIRFIQAGKDGPLLEMCRYNRILLVTVLGEVTDKVMILKELAGRLEKDGILSITEVIADPHFQRCKTVRELARTAGLTEAGFYGSALSYTMNFTKTS
jgi:ubiquinone/menaquinone biosynthesis C-methylase UbiE